MYRTAATITQPSLGLDGPYPTPTLTSGEGSVVWRGVVDKQVAASLVQDAEELAVQHHLRELRDHLRLGKIDRGGHVSDLHRAVRLDDLQ